MADSQVRVSFFNDKDDGVPKPWTGTWGELCTILEPPGRPVFADKVLGAVFCPAEFHPGTTSRVRENVLRVHFAMLEFHGLTVAQYLALPSKLAGLDALLWGHARRAMMGGWEARVCVRLSRPVEASEWPHFYSAVMRRFGNIGDLRGEDPSHCYSVCFPS